MNLCPGVLVFFSVFDNAGFGHIYENKIIEKNVPSCSRTKSEKKNWQIYGTSEDRGAARQTNERSPPSTHVLLAFRLNAPLSSLDLNLLYVQYITHCTVVCRLH